MKIVFTTGIKKTEFGDRYGAQVAISCASLIEAEHLLMSEGKAYAKKHQDEFKGICYHLFLIVVRDSHLQNYLIVDVG